MTTFTIYIDDEAMPSSSDYSVPGSPVANFSRREEFKVLWKQYIDDYDFHTNQFINIHIFKSTVQPERSDPSNHDGGKCWITTSRSFVLESFEAMVDELLFNDCSFFSSINGITACLKTETNSTMGIWIKSCEQHIIHSCKRFIEEGSKQTEVMFEKHKDENQRRPSFFSMLADTDEIKKEGNETKSPETENKNKKSIEEVEGKIIQEIYERPKTKKIEEGFNELMEIADPDDFLQQFVEAELELSTEELWGDIYEANKMLFIAPSTTLEIKLRSFHKILNYSGIMTDCGKRKKSGEKKVNPVRVSKKIKESFTSSEDTSSTEINDSFGSLSLEAVTPDTTFDGATLPDKIIQHSLNTKSQRASECIDSKVINNTNEAKERIEEIKVMKEKENKKIDEFEMKDITIPTMVSKESESTIESSESITKFKLNAKPFTRKNKTKTTESSIESQSIGDISDESSIIETGVISDENKPKVKINIDLTKPIKSYIPHHLKEIKEKTSKEVKEETSLNHEKGIKDTEDNIKEKKGTKQKSETKKENKKTHKKEERKKTRFIEVPIQRDIAEPIIQTPIQIESKSNDKDNIGFTEVPYQIEKTETTHNKTKSTTTVLEKPIAIKTQREKDIKGIPMVSKSPGIEKTKKSLLLMRRTKKSIPSTPGEVKRKQKRENGGNEVKFEPMRKHNPNKVMEIDKPKNEGNETESRTVVTPPTRLPWHIRMLKKASESGEDFVLVFKYHTQIVVIVITVMILTTLMIIGLMYLINVESSYDD
ncbi:hypothetical protein KM1_141530 [Entamoeba histolytica HM-3:IMSS]|uniref:Uncharacterized protein n=4 Tax=Entamoeba histolytica TaxID=5759 RepID=C4LVB1_ENTH1|nr:hypothetical protein EHI_196930 [Entamoeba histolytica HM-1:IMSS]EAL47774.2 hypothetical protein EHI_196930 [Entamoeba histolytica HM-1:IMSS]EMD44555.1 Hypothetical protein EHI5A_059480 [Entamoeba histolytica KU27]EMS13968.1 hypothetical protein KM1_141530 [Entamoeba histolytica HM-3:IMSS]GAT92597.1 hypothetical protein CL6EHI_196930 [Entamoeba histolytica]|eukprot:XP_653161.2 hypothetical protein EHI_196930 [Entamoeba histolytica HM-1:IMSS]